MVKRIIDSTTGLFLRDDFAANDGEIALNVVPASGFYWPKWDFANQSWIEGGTAPEPSNEPTPEEIAEAETKVLITETLIELGVLV